MERHTSLSQFVLSTKSGCECVAHIAQTQRCCCWWTRSGLSTPYRAKQCCRGSQRWKVRCFAFRQVADDAGGTHGGVAGRGRRTGRPLKPALYAPRALVHVSEELLDSERLYAFMDDVCVCCGPDRVADIHQLLGREMWARIQLHQGKTQFWNRGGTAPHGWRQ